MRASWPSGILSGEHASFRNVLSYLNHLVRSIPEYANQGLITRGKLGSRNQCVVHAPQVEQNRVANEEFAAWDVVNSIGVQGSSDYRNCEGDVRPSTTEGIASALGTLQ